MRKKQHTPILKAHIDVPQDCLLAWGRHAVEAAVANPLRKIVRLYLTPERAEAMRDRIDNRVIESIDKALLTEAVGRFLPSDEKAVIQGMVAVMRPLLSPSLEDWLDGLAGERVVVLLLDQITDARNVGAIMRSARAFGAAGIIAPEKHCPRESGVMLRVASGAAETVPLVRVVNLARTIEKLQNSGFMVAGMTASGTVSIARLAEYERLGIVMGAEGKGLRRMTQEHADLLVTIPIADGAESLNVSAAAAVALFAAQGQNRDD